MRILAAFVCLGLALGARGARAGQMPSDVASLVAAERAFAEMSVTVSMRDAFLENLADDGLVFRPGPVNGKELWRDRPASNAVLSWEPVYAEVAEGGDVGFTTGPWEFRPDRDSEPVAFGHYVSVWRRDGDGPWKVVADIGIDHARVADAPVLSWTTRKASRLRTSEPVALLHAADERFAQAAAVDAASAYRAHGVTDLRLYRAGMPPVTGLDAACDLAGAVPATDMKPTKVDCGGDGEFGYTIGSVGTPVSAWYLRIWRLDEGEWKIVLDVLSPVPPERE
ncbi:MAG TPA: nuclear transport factor 2 family protein [Candidatus Krumholzibacteria bacterium]|nr:nuclear transport factor 2 family protein [Candidatus Krumholzibacteria bacterium]